MAESEEKLAWEGLCSRDVRTRKQAMKNIKQMVQSAISLRGPFTSVGDTPESSEINQMLARLLMLSKRCPFPDVRVKSLEILNKVQEDFMEKSCCFLLHELCEDQC
ncbi:uncharacterized protein RB166_003981 [Leptodactylus fuscus]